MSSTQEKLTFQPPHTLSEQEKAFLASLPEKERELHQLASEKLGSSYFVGKTHAFTAWQKNQVNQGKQSQAAR